MPRWIEAWVGIWLTPNRAEIGLSVFGMIALVTPLLLWVAFSITMLKIVLSVGLGSIMLAIFCAQFCCRDEVPEEEQTRPPDVDEMLKLMGRMGSGSRSRDRAPPGSGRSGGSGWRDNA